MTISKSTDTAATNKDSNIELFPVTQPSNKAMADEIFDLQNILILADAVVGDQHSVCALQYALDQANSKLCRLAELFDDLCERENALHENSAEAAL